MRVASQITPLCTAVANRAPSPPGVPNGGSARGYQEPFASFGCMAVMVTAQRSVGEAVCLCIAALAVNVLNCRGASVWVWSGYRFGRARVGPGKGGHRLNGKPAPDRATDRAGRGGEVCTLGLPRPTSPARRRTSVIIPGFSPSARRLLWLIFHRSPTSR
jgi:hypothetical protein